MDKKKKNYIISGVLILVAILFTILVKFIDVKAVGVNGTNIGFATINKYVFDLIGTNNIFDKISDILGLIPLILVMVYAFVGLMQLVKKKSLKKVDREIIILGGFYVVVAVLYVFFEKCIINYRPILVDGVLEASYPSSHTLMSLCFCGSAMILNKRYFKNLTKYHFNIVLGIVAIMVPVCRLLAGVHWLTDIIGGFLISAALLMTFYVVVNSKKTYQLKDRTKKKRR